MSGNGWSNRIIGHAEIDPEELLAHPKNWRIHPKVQQEALTGVLDKVGWVSRVIVNKRTGFVVDGHLRVSLALRRHEPSIPVQYIDVTEEEEMLILATLDPIAALAVSDMDKLGELLKDLGEQPEAIDRLLKTVAGEQIDVEGFNKPNDEPVLTLKVNFASMEDVEAFASLVDQPVTMDSTFIWYPEQETIPEHSLAGKHA